MPQLNVEKRDIFGKKLKALKDDGNIPAVLYGRNKETAHLFISLKDFKKVWKDAGESTVVELKGADGENTASVLIHDIAIDPIKDEPVHVDFYAVEMDKLIKANIQLVFSGVAPAVKELGGILVKVMHEIEIEALPKDLPHEINVDISGLKTFEDRIFAKDLNLPSAVKISANPDEVIALAEAPKEEAEEEEKMSIEDIEVAKKGKEEKEDVGEEKKEASKK